MAPKTFIAFDVGIKHLSFIEATTQDAVNSMLLDLDIKRWDILDISVTKEGYTISTKEFTLLSENMLRILKERFDPLQYDTVVIENQPVLKNPIMKSLQIVLYTYFAYSKVDTTISNKPRIKFVNASNKLKPNAIISKEDIERVQLSIPKAATAYANRKKLGVALTSHVLQKGVVVQNSSKWLAELQVSRKKDDLADAFLMVLNMLCQESQNSSPNAFQST